MVYVYFREFKGETWALFGSIVSVWCLPLCCLIFLVFISGIQRVVWRFVLLFELLVFSLSLVNIRRNKKLRMFIKFLVYVSKTKPYSPSIFDTLFNLGLPKLIFGLFLHFSNLANRVKSPSLVVEKGLGFASLNFFFWSAMKFNFMFSGKCRKLFNIFKVKRKL